MVSLKSYLNVCIIFCDTSLLFNKKNKACNFVNFFYKKDMYQLVQ